MKNWQQMLVQIGLDTVVKWWGRKQAPEIDEQPARCADCHHQVLVHTPQGCRLCTCLTDYNDNELSGKSQ